MMKHLAVLLALIACASAFSASFKTTEPIASSPRRTRAVPAALNVREYYSTHLGFSPGQDVTDYINYLDGFFNHGGSAARIAILPKEWMDGQRHYTQIIDYAISRGKRVYLVLPQYYYNNNIPSWMPSSTWMKYPGGAAGDGDYMKTPSLALLKNADQSNNPFYRFKEDFLRTLLTTYKGKIFGVSTANQQNMELGYPVTVQNGRITQTAGYEDIAHEDFKNFCIARWTDLSHINAALGTSYTDLNQIRLPDLNTDDFFAGAHGKAAAAYRLSTIVNYQKWFYQAVKSIDPSVFVAADCGQTNSNMGLVYGTFDGAAIGEWSDWFKENFTEDDEWGYVDRLIAYSSNGLADAEMDGSHMDSNGRFVNGYTSLNDAANNMKKLIARGGRGVSFFAMANSGRIAASYQMLDMLVAAYPAGQPLVTRDTGNRQSNINIDYSFGRDWAEQWRQQGGQSYPVKVTVSHMNLPAPYQPNGTPAPAATNPPSTPAPSTPAPTQKPATNAPTPAPATPAPTQKAATSAPTPTIPATTAYIGCFSDTMDRVLSGYSYQDTALTIEKCRATCVSRGFAFTGLESSTECYCGNSYSKGNKVDESYCSKVCSGNANQKCGGEWKLSIYTSQDTTVVTPQPATPQPATSQPATPQPATPKPATAAPVPTASSSSAARNLTANNNYYGCITDSGLTSASGINRMSRNTKIDTCRYFCGARSYSVAFMKLGSTCYCGNQVLTTANAPVVADSQCSTSCVADNNQKCGSSSSVSVYTSAGTAEGVFGCYAEDLSNPEFSFKKEQGTGMNIDLCRAGCSDMGQQYAALRNGNTCYCSNSYGRNGKVSSSQCNIPCSGDSSAMCGGTNANLVFSSLTDSRIPRLPVCSPCNFLMEEQNFSFMLAPSVVLVVLFGAMMLLM